MSAQLTITEVSGKYGAPMGRGDWGIEPEPGVLVHVFRVSLDSGGYDQGGAYWGHGQPIYCATDGKEYRRFVRADYRELAILMLADALVHCKVRGGFKFYDNGGASFDRYTAFMPGLKCRISGTNPSGRHWQFVAMSERPYHPQGFGQHGDSAVPPAGFLGRQITFDELPQDCQSCFLQACELDD